MSALAPVRYNRQDGQAGDENGGKVDLKKVKVKRQKWEILYALHQSLTPSFFHLLRISLLE